MYAISSSLVLPALSSPDDDEEDDDEEARQRKRTDEVRAPDGDDASRRARPTIIARDDVGSRRWRRRLTTTRCALTARADVEEDIFNLFILSLSLAANRLGNSCGDVVTGVIKLRAKG